MAKKKELKQSEARIIMYLFNAETQLRYIRKIAAKLQMDYGYCITIMNQMFEKKWITKDKVHSKTFVNLTKKAPVEKAKKVWTE